MKKTQKLTFSGIMAALSVVLLLCGYFPYLTYAIPAVAGLFIMVAFVEAGVFYAIGAYISSAVISLILCEKEVALLYLLLFGFYPVLKAYIEKIKKPVPEWIIKIAAFNISVLLVYLATRFIIGISYDNLGVLGKYGAPLFLLLCNAVFVLYDIAIARVAAFYFAKLHDKIKGVFK